MHQLCFAPTPRLRNIGMSAETISVDNYSDWQLRRYGVGEWPVGLSFWLRSATLSFLSQHDQGVATRAVAVHHQPSGRSVYLTVQDLHFTAQDQVSDRAKGQTSSWDLRRTLLRPLRIKVLCLGQLLTSGPRGQYGLDQLKPDETVQLVQAVASTLLRRSTGYRGVLVKDLFDRQSVVVSRFEAKGYMVMPTDPIMEVDLVWPDLAQYLASLSSKYRVRYRRARGKLGGLSRRRLPTREVKARLDRIYELYGMTLRSAVVNFTALTSDYFAWLAEVAVVHGYFDDADGRLMGFTTGIEDGQRYQAHYLGFEETANQQHHLYHNMLFDLLQDAIEGGFATLDYGRTALEIKSSVGAVPHEYATLLWLRNPVLNRLVPRFVPAVFTPAPWQQRGPFREDSVNR